MNIMDPCFSPAPVRVRFPVENEIKRTAASTRRRTFSFRFARRLSVCACALLLCTQVDIISGLLSGRLVREKVGPAVRSAVQSQVYSLTQPHLKPKCTRIITLIAYQPVREAVNDRELFTAGWFGVREKHCSWLEIYDRLRASEQAVCSLHCKNPKFGTGWSIGSIDQQEV